MRLDNYNGASFEAYEPFEPAELAESVQREGNPSPNHSGAETLTPEPAVIEEVPSPWLSQMARNPPPLVLAPMPPAPPLELRRLPMLEERRAHLLRERQERFEFDGSEEGGEDAGLPRGTTPPAPVIEPAAPSPVPDPAPQPLADSAAVAVVPVQAPPAPAVTPPAAAPATAPATAPAVSIPLPLGDAVDPAWLNQREAALKTLRTGFEAAREAARNTPPADIATAAAGWVQAVTHGQGEMPGGAVWVPDAAAAAATPAWGWMAREGIGTTPADTGQWMIFDDGAYEQAYRGQLDAQAAHGASAPLATLAQLYGAPGQNALASHPELWTLATQDHALNAGPPPRPGVAMGDALSLGQLDLYLADPFITQLRTQLGGAPAAATGALAQQQQRLYGTERYAELTQLSQAMAAVRQQHAAAMQAARASGGTGWVDVPMQLGTDPETGWPTGIYATVGDGQIQRDANGATVLATQRVFDEALFTNAWLAEGERSGGLAQQAFAQFYGHAQSHIALSTDGGSESGASLTWVSAPGLDNPHAGLVSEGVWDGDLITLDLNRAPKLNSDAAVGFDPQLGWVTPRDNLYEHRDWFERAAPLALVAFTAWATAGATSGWSAISSAAATGAAASAASGIVNGNLSLKGVLIGAVSGALTAGLTPGLTGILKDAGLGAAAGIAARMTVQGGIQALLGGSFKDGAIAAFASGLADLASTNIGENIAQAVATGTMSASEALAARAFNTMLSSAIRAAGSPGDPTQAFASAWLDGLMRDNLPPVVTGVQTFPVPAAGPVEVTPLPAGDVNPPPVPTPAVEPPPPGADTAAEAGQPANPPSSPETPPLSAGIVREFQYTGKDGRGFSASLVADGPADLNVSLDANAAIVRDAGGRYFYAASAATTELPAGWQVLAGPGQTVMIGATGSIVLPAGLSASELTLAAALSQPAIGTGTQGLALSPTGEFNPPAWLSASVRGSIYGLILSPVEIGGGTQISNISPDIRLVRPGNDVLEGNLELRTSDAEGKEQWVRVTNTAYTEAEVRAMQDKLTPLLRRDALTPEQIAELGKPLIYVPAPRAPDEGQLPTPALDPNDTRMPTPGYGTTEPLPPFEVPGFEGHTPHWSDFILTMDGDRVYVPSRTEPTGQLGGEATGAMTANSRNADSDNKGDIAAENRALADMANAGYRTERNPTLTQAERDAQGLSETTNPDARIEGKVFDVKASRTPAAAQNAIEDSVQKGQARRFVISTDNFDNPEAGAREIAARLRSNPMDGLLEVKIVVNGIVKNIYP